MGVAITGTVTTGPDGVPEVCAPGRTHDCFGVAIEGELPDGLSDQVVYRLTGGYDGRTITLTEPPREVGRPPTAPIDFSTPCDGMTGGGADPIEAIHRYTDSVPDRFAGLWWDQASRVYTVWFTDADPAEHDAAIATATDGAPVCVIGGAAHSESELRAAQDDVVQAFGDQLAMNSVSTDVIRNLVVVDAEQADQELLAAISELSSAIEVQAFLTVLDGTVADVPAPVPVRPGNIELRTGRTRAGGGMAALGAFSLGFDADLGCFYLDQPDGTRVLPIWPLGFSGDSGPPATVYDWDGQPFAAAGDALELGGGAGLPATGGGTCGATETWVVNL